MGILINYKNYSGSENMGIDSKLLENAILQNQKEPVLRFYGWEPKCVSLGRNQASSNINHDFCKKNKIDIVRRITGGRGLLHDNELTYSFICPINFLTNGSSVIASYKEISSALIAGFKYLDIELSIGGKTKINTDFEYCMSLSTGADLNYNNKKLIGSAQYRNQNYILQHGSILFGYDKYLLENIFREEINTSSLTCIQEINSEISRVQAEEAIIKGFKEYFNIPFRHLS